MTQLTDCATAKLNLPLSYSNTLPPHSFHPFLWIKYYLRSVRVFYYHCGVSRSVTVCMRRTKFLCLSWSVLSSDIMHAWFRTCVCVCAFMRVCVYVHSLCVGTCFTLCVIYVLHSLVFVCCVGSIWAPPTLQLSVLTGCRLVHQLHVCLWQWSTQSLVHVPKWSEAELTLPRCSPVSAV